MEALQMRFRIIDCHENFSNFLAMTENFTMESSKEELKILLKPPCNFTADCLV
ncbi:hypothetical protein [Helicobacter rodentium]|uniref:hypothetical protein n=1 Tax=Helicobacter rodentium TaxID=59617 RepID=UPI00235744FF|nr:hypothetical protein [Helicobacter rodentium]